ncbi:MAG: OmpA family protein [Bacteroidia bacterium]|nr:OmpA family protein [Bacteroidia bacterium]
MKVYFISLMLLGMSLRMPAQTLVKRNYKPINDTVFKAGDIIKAPNIWFQFGACGILPEGKDSVQLIADFVLKHPKHKIEIGVHTDIRGNKTANLKLSQCRADSVLAIVLKVTGISPKNIVAKGYGSTQPLVDARSVGARASLEEQEMVYFKNKRVELKILEVSK